MPIPALDAGGAETASKADAWVTPLSREFRNCCFRQEGLTLERAAESPGVLVATQAAGPRDLRF